jgi:hypothetical protein
MLGDAAVYRRGTRYNSAKFFDLEYTTAGWVPVRLDWDNTPLDPGPDVRTGSSARPALESQRVVCRGQHVIGFNMLGGRWNHEVMLGDRFGRSSTTSSTTWRRLSSTRSSPALAQVAKRRRVVVLVGD